MPNFTITKRINVPVEAVFDVASDAIDRFAHYYFRATNRLLIRSSEVATGDPLTSASYDTALHFANESSWPKQVPTR